MLESYQITSSTDKILNRFSLSLNEYALPINGLCTIEKGAMGYVITSENERELRRMKFGFTPHWAKTPMDLLTARAEGDKNLENNPFYNGPNAIFLKPAFKKAIQHYRCLVVADGYIDNSTKQPHLIALSENKFPVVFAGIYDYWKDPQTGIIQPGFSIISTTASGILQHVGIKRMPVILSFFNCISWIRSPKPLNYYLPMLDRSNIQLVNLISLDDEVKTEKQIQKEKIPDTQHGSLSKRYYGKRHLHTTIDRGTIEERINKSNL